MNEIKNIVKTWQDNLQNFLKIEEIYLFGSSIIDNGYLFDSSDSDIDLVVKIPNELTNAIERTQWLEKLSEYKSDLELEFIKLFNRTSTSITIVSILPITQVELDLDIHKLGVRDFFSQNEFLNITNNENVYGIRKNREDEVVDDVVRQILEFTQTVRNKYLHTSFVQDSHPLDWQSKKDIAPKELIRNNAIAAYIKNGRRNSKEKTDLKSGLAHLSHYLYSRRHDDKLYMELYDWLSKRMLSKGERIPLSKKNYLLLSEMLFDMALTQNPKSKNKITSFKSTPHNISEAIPVTFHINMSGLINGKDGDLFRDITNAGVNLAWQTSPYFEIILEEKGILLTRIKEDPLDGQSLDKLRKLNLISKDLITGYQFIIYYQNHFFKGSNNILKDILTALRAFTMTAIANVIIRKDLKGVEEGFLQAYVHGYQHNDFNNTKIKIDGVLNFGLPKDILEDYLKTHPELNKLYKSADIFSLAANNQPLKSISTDLLAQFFIPLLIVRLVESGLSAIPKDSNEEKLCMYYTNIENWSFGVM